MNIKQDLKINEHDLKGEWISIPMKIMEYGEKALVLRKKVDKAKRQIAITEIETARDVRANPQDYGLAKVTEAAVKEKVAVSTEVQDAKDAHMEIKAELDHMELARTSLDAKRKALEHLVQLQISGYNSTPDAGRVDRKTRRRRRMKKGNEE